MRLLKVELKNALKSRKTVFFIAAGIIISILLAVAPILFVSADVKDDNGDIQKLNGIKAIQYWRNIKSVSDGEVTPEKLKDALTVYKECRAKYGDPDTEGIPDDVYLEKIAPVDGLLRLFKFSYCEFKGGNLINRDIGGIGENEVDAFYDETDERLLKVIKVEKEPKDTITKAQKLFSKVDRPFMLYEGYTRDACDYIAFSILFLVLLGVALSASVFSDNYETDADHIIRCAKYGRGKYAVTKIISNTILTLLMYITGISIHLLISDLAFGRDTLQTSVQALYDTISLPAMNIFQLQITLAVAGLLSILSVSALTYFLSARLDKNVKVLGISLLLALLPLFIYVGVGNNWISSILPAGGIGLQNSMLEQLVDFRFLHIGSHSFWMPQVTMFFTILWIPVFLILAVKSYCKHRV